MAGFWNSNLTSYLHKFKDEVENQFDSAVHDTADAVDAAEANCVVDVGNTNCAVDSSLRNQKETVDKVAEALNWICTQVEASAETKVEMEIRLNRKVEMLQLQLMKKGKMKQENNGAVEWKRKHDLVMAEGERLSNRQVQFENRIRGLRKELDAEKEKNVLKGMELEKVELEKSEMEKGLKERDGVCKENERLKRERRKIMEEKEELNGRLERLIEEKERMEVARNELEVELKSAKSSEMEVANNEYVMMKSTIIHLQEECARIQHEAGLREEGLQAKIKDMRQRWQSALLRVDEMESSVSSSTQPLLRQIAAFQMDQRNRAKAWSETEKGLLARIAAMEEERNGLEKIVGELKVDKHAIQEKLSLVERSVTSLNVQIAHEKKRSLQSKNHVHVLEERYAALQESTKQDCSLQKQHAREISKLRKTHEEQLHQVHSTLPLLESQKAAIEQDAKDLRLELMRLKAKPKEDLTSTGNASSHQHHTFNLEACIESPSMYNMNQTMQDLRRKEGEVKALQHQLHAMESSKSDLSEQVIRLQHQCTTMQDYDAIRQELQITKQKQEVLLELLGEKEEQLEELEEKYEKCISN